MSHSVSTSLAAKRVNLRQGENTPPVEGFGDVRKLSTRPLDGGDQRSPRPASERPRQAKRRPLSQLVAKYVHPSGNRFTLVYSVVLFSALYLGWRVRAERYLSAEEGTGYALGIVGGVMMAILLLYPVRKKLKILRGFGAVTHWFRIHMLFGTLGPALILFHANFRIGSLNSSVALFAMLLVAASGIVGRFFYSRIHLGLYGRKTEAREILADMATLKRALGTDLCQAPVIEAELKRFEEQMLLPYRNVLSSLVRARKLARETRRSRASMVREVRRVVADQAKRRNWSRRQRAARIRGARRHLDAYFAALRQAGQFAFYERLFALWHVFHLPLFYFLVLAAVTHVVAVHLY